MISGRIYVTESQIICGSRDGTANVLYPHSSYTHPVTKQCNYTYTHPSDIQCDAASEINSLKSSVSNGKSLIASAITGKGVSTASNATFQTMANNISSLPSPAFETLFFSGQWIYMPGNLNNNINTPIGLPRAFAFAPDDSKAYVYLRDSQKLYYWRLVPDYSDTQTLDTSIEVKTETFNLSVPVFGVGSSARLTVDPIVKTWYVDRQCKTMFAIY